MTMKLREKLELLRQSHYECEDPFYSCHLDENRRRFGFEMDECTCGADRHNAIIDEILAANPPEQEPSTHPISEAVYFVPFSG